jgi:acylphosphatase
LRTPYAIIEAMNQNEQHQREELSVTISGRVQGVGFRYFVIEKARTLGLSGYVRNDSFGDVEVVAQGPRPALGHLLLLLRQGPPAAQVHHIQSEWREPTQHISGFHIRW